MLYHLIMELKKSPKADLENKRNIFVQLGLVVALAICLYGFESTTRAKKVDTFDTGGAAKLDEEVAPVTRQDQPPPPPPPPPPKVVDVLNIVDNEIGRELLRL